MIHEDRLNEASIKWNYHFVDSQKTTNLSVNLRQIMCSFIIIPFNVIDALQMLNEFSCFVELWNWWWMRMLGRAAQQNLRRLKFMWNQENGGRSPTYAIEFASSQIYLLAAIDGNNFVGHPHWHRPWFGFCEFRPNFCWKLFGRFRCFRLVTAKPGLIGDYRPLQKTLFGRKYKSKPKWLWLHQCVCSNCSLQWLCDCLSPFGVRAQERDERRRCQTGKLFVFAHRKLLRNYYNRRFDAPFAVDADVVLLHRLRIS